MSEMSETKNRLFVLDLPNIEFPHKRTTLVWDCPDYKCIAISMTAGAVTEESISLFYEEIRFLIKEFTEILEGKTDKDEIEEDEIETVRAR